ncbi:MAG TPA: hypothetical protein PLR91_07720 [Kiritimatiellia bacterium]|jgi:hypothetical protein|nr:MAG: hypothetical protein BWX70_01446 [Verrucomicrobia bacterium ADurb.Bin070]HQL51064.1 hypothetical protein [Kiritimatiellia bacterium]
MKTPIMLACALVLATVLNGRTQEKAATPATPAVPAAPAAVEKDANAGKGKGAKLTPEQREAMVTKRLEQIKAKDEALYKELVELKEKDPKAFRDKMREQGRGQGKGKGKGNAEGQQPGKGKGRGKGKGQPQAE